MMEAAPRKPALAALLSAVVPGAGQLYAGRRLRAVLFFLPHILLVATLVAGYRRGGLGLAELAVQTSYLRGFIAADLAFLAWRIWATIDAFVVAAGREHRTEGAKAIVVVLVAVLVVPHLLAGVWAYEGIDLIDTVFTAEEDPTPTTTIPLEPEDVFNGESQDPQLFYDWYAPIERSSRNMIFRKDLGDPDAIAALADILHPPSVVTAPFLPYEERVGTDRLTILLVGGDAGPGRSGLRTDTMMVATIDIETGRSAIFGLPRNMKYIPLPERFHGTFVEDEWEALLEYWAKTDYNQDGYPDDWVDLDGDTIPDQPEFESCDCYPDMLNTIHGRTEGWSRSYPDSPDPGMSALRDVISHVLDLDIDYFVLVDMAAFVKGVDAIGGVTVMVQQPMHVTVSAPWEGSPKATVNVEAGLNHLDGLEALAYSRWRWGSSDYARMQRQRCLVRAAAAQADPFTLLRNFPTIADVMKDYVVTDIPSAFLPDLVRIAGKLDFSQIATVGFVPPTYITGRASGGYPIPDVDKIRWKVRQVLDEGVSAQSRTGESECGI